MKNNYTIDFSLPLKSGGRVDYMKIRPKPNRVKPNMQEQISQILAVYGGDPMLTNEEATNQLLTLIKKHERGLINSHKCPRHQMICICQEEILANLKDPSGPKEVEK